MKVRDAIRVFGSRAAICEALAGIRNRSAVYQWGQKEYEAGKVKSPDDGLIPQGAAYALAAKAPRGTLKVNPELYVHAHRTRRRNWKRKHGH